MMKLKFAGIAVLILVYYPVTSFNLFEKPALIILYLCSMKWIKLAQDFRGTLLRHCWKYWIQNKTLVLVIIIWQSPFDLSHVMFIGTANVLDNIPIPLRDRMEVIELSGYTLDEKIQIARRYLVARQLESNGLTAEQCSISDQAIETIIQDYTREAGCRNLEREIGAVFRHVAMSIAEDIVVNKHIDSEHIIDILGPKKFDLDIAMRTSLPSVATGLAWTPVGGDILFIEVTKIPGKGKLILTGQLGDVMKESAQTALSLLSIRGLKPPASSRLVLTDKISYFEVCYGLQVL